MWDQDDSLLVRPGPGVGLGEPGVGGWGRVWHIPQPNSLLVRLGPGARSGARGRGSWGGGWPDLQPNSPPGRERECSWVKEGEKANPTVLGAQGPHPTESAVWEVSHSRTHSCSRGPGPGGGELGVLCELQLRPLQGLVHRSGPRRPWCGWSRRVLSLQLELDAKYASQTCGLCRRLQRRPRLL